MLSNAVFLHSSIVVDVIRVEIFDKNHRHHRKVLITYSWYLLGYECCFIFYFSYPFSGGTAKSLSRTQVNYVPISYCDSSVGLRPGCCREDDKERCVGPGRDLNSCASDASKPTSSSKESVFRLVKLSARSRASDREVQN